MFGATSLLVLASPTTNTSEGSRSGSVNRSDLDTDIVEAFPVPVLFGVDYDALVPDFGDVRGGGTRSHEGQDMRESQGAPIVSRQRQ
jgi:hypothetical protein